MTYQAIYKCRLCGEVFIGCEETNNTWDATKRALRKIKTGKRQRHIHICADGSIGIADFQGFKAVKE